MALGWVCSWKLINERRVARHGRPFLDKGAESAPASPYVPFVFVLLQRNHSRSHRRYLRARSSSSQNGCDVLQDERHLVEPSDDEDIPVTLPGAHLDLPEHFSLPLACLDPRSTVQSVRRPGYPEDMGSYKERRTGKDPEESDLDAGAMVVGTYFAGGAPGFSVRTSPPVDPTIYGLPVLNLGNRRLAVSEEDRKNAIDSPTAGSSSFARLYNLGVRSRPSPRDAFRAGPLVDMDPDARYHREWGRDVAPLALAAAAAVKVDQSAW